MAHGKSIFWTILSFFLVFFYVLILEDRGRNIATQKDIKEVDWIGLLEYLYV